MESKIKRLFYILIKSLCEIIFPREDKCIICKENYANGICFKCRSKIVLCTDDELCIGYYKGPLKELILKLKYKKDFNAGEILVELLEDKLKYINDEYYITFIPIGKESLRTRGFNQCEYLAKEIGFRKNIPVIDTLEKTRETKIQKTLNMEERKTNLIGAFKLKNNINIKDKKIILIDDVVTTGATINEGRKVLKENGALEIKILTLAKSHI